MSIRITDHPRIGAWLAARANDTFIEAYQRAEDALSIERHKVRTLQSQLADRGEAIAALHEEVDELQEEVRVLHIALKRTESERDEMRGLLAGSSVVSEVEAFLSTYTEGEQK